MKIVLELKKMDCRKDSSLADVGCADELFHFAIREVAIKLARHLGATSRKATTLV